MPRRAKSLLLNAMRAIWRTSSHREEKGMAKITQITPYIYSS
jgi:hypothetical protein